MNNTITFKYRIVLSYTIYYNLDLKYRYFYIITGYPYNLKDGFLLMLWYILYVEK